VTKTKRNFGRKTWNLRILYKHSPVPRSWDPGLYFCI